MFPQGFFLFVPHDFFSHCKLSFRQKFKSSLEFGDFWVIFHSYLRMPFHFESKVSWFNSIAFPLSALSGAHLRLQNTQQYKWEHYNWTSYHWKAFYATDSSQWVLYDNREKKNVFCLTMVTITLPPVTTESMKKQKQWELESTYKHWHVLLYGQLWHSQYAITLDRYVWILPLLLQLL